MKRRDLKKAALLRFTSGALALGFLFFGTAGTLRYWEAWIFLAVLFLPAGLAAAYLLGHDPELMEARLRAREERRVQKAYVWLGSMVWLVAFVIPGLDRRFGWSSVPTWAVILGDVLVLGGYLVFFLTLRENRYASRIIRLVEGQTVITSGPYARVRHPMYAGVLIMLLAAPLALGSWWAVLPALATPLLLFVRIRDEEEALLDGLPGYQAYTETTRYRLIPGVW